MGDSRQLWSTMTQDMVEHSNEKDHMETLKKKIHAFVDNTRSGGSAPATGDKHAPIIPRQHRF